MKTVDLRDAQSAKLMLMRAEYIIASACHAGENLIKFVTATPYLTEKLRACIRTWIRAKKVSFMIYGEKYAKNDEKTQFLLNHFPTEAADPDIGKGDPFITVVCFTLQKKQA